MPKKEKVFRCAMYLRLSKEDDSIATASNSIVNQEKMIRMYIDDHDDLVFKKKYVDATVIIGLKQNPTIGRRFSPIFSFIEHLSGKYSRCYT